MSREFAGNFYRSKRWRRCRENYLHSVGHLCELCLKEGLYNPAEIVHHKVYLTKDNIGDPEISMNPANLMAVCRMHHALIHDNQIFLPDNRAPWRYSVDPDGKVIIEPDDQTKQPRKQYRPGAGPDPGHGGGVGS